MKKLHLMTALIMAMMMCLLLTSFAAADTTYDSTVDVGDFAEPICITPDILEQNVSYEMDGTQIAVWNGASRTLTVKGPLDVSTQQGFLWFDTYGFGSEKEATIVIDGHVKLSSENGHCIDAWVGEDEEGNFPFDFELTLTSTGYNAQNPSASASSLSIVTTGQDNNGIQSSVINVKDLYIPELNTNLIGMYGSAGVTLTNVTIDSAVSENDSILGGAWNGSPAITLDNVAIHSLSAAVNAIGTPGTITLTDTQISNLNVGEFGFNADSGIVIENCEFSSMETGIHTISSSSTILVENTTAADVTSGAAFICTDTQVTVTNSAFDNITTTGDYAIHGMGNGAVLQNSSITNSTAVDGGAALGGDNILIENSTITNYTGENIVSCSGDITIENSTLTGVTTWSSVWAGGDIVIEDTTLVATSTLPDAPGIYTDTGNFTLDGVSMPAPEDPLVSITPDAPVVPEPTPVPTPTPVTGDSLPQTGDNTPLLLLSVLLLSVLLLISMAGLIRFRKLSA